MVWSYILECNGIANGPIDLFGIVFWLSNAGGATLYDSISFCVSTVLGCLYVMVVEGEQYEDFSETTYG